jgi:hypothetical protein
MKAKESISFEEIVAGLPLIFKRAELRINRIKSLVSIPDDALLLDVGAAQGEYVAAYKKLGYRAVGV